MIVIDASVALAWTFPDESTDFACGVRDRVLREGALVPAVWTLEVTNAIVQAERKRRIDAAAATAALALFQDLPVTVEPGSLAEDFNLVAALARDHPDHGMTASDAAYLSLARKEGVALATLDEPLARCARKLGVSVIGPEV